MGRVKDLLVYIVFTFQLSNWAKAWLNSIYQTFSDNFPGPTPFHPTAKFKRWSPASATESWSSQSQNHAQPSQQKTPGQRQPMGWGKWREIQTGTSTWRPPSIPPPTGVRPSGAFRLTGKWREIQTGPQISLLTGHTPAGPQSIQETVTGKLHCFWWLFLQCCKVY